MKIHCVLPASLSLYKGLEVKSQVFTKCQDKALTSWKTGGLSYQHTLERQSSARLGTLRQHQAKKVGKSSSSLAVYLVTKR